MTAQERRAGLRGEWDPAVDAARVDLLLVDLRVDASRCSHHRSLAISCWLTTTSRLHRSRPPPRAPSPLISISPTVTATRTHSAVCTNCRPLCRRRRWGTAPPWTTMNLHLRGRPRTTSSLWRISEKQSVLNHLVCMWSCNLERIQNRALSSLRRVRGFTCVVCLVNVVEAMSTSNNSSQVNQDGTGKKKSVWSKLRLQGAR
jgi:hypothetical protein